MCGHCMCLGVACVGLDVILGSCMDLGFMCMGGPCVSVGSHICGGRCMHWWGGSVCVWHPLCVRVPMSLSNPLSAGVCKCPVQAGSAIHVERNVLGGSSYGGAQCREWPGRGLACVVRGGADHLCGKVPCVTDSFIRGGGGRCVGARHVGGSGRAGSCLPMGSQVLVGIGVCARDTLCGRRGRG